MTRQQRAALPYMHPGRVDVIGAGALIWRTVSRRLAALTADAWTARRPANTIFWMESP